MFAVYLLSMGGLALSALCMLRLSPSLAALVEVDGKRFASLDGLRGLLASGVFIHHAAVYQVYASEGVWRDPSDRLLRSLGGDCVNVFFMITGFLFWRKALLGGGRLARAELLRSRVRRVMPAYLVVATLVIAVALAQTRFTLRESPGEIALEVTRWLAGGLLGAPPINGVGAVPINCGVTWTLQYEWCFYLALPLLAWFASDRRAPLLLGIFFALWGAARWLRLELPFSPGSLSRFLMGMLVAHLVVRWPDLAQLRSRAVSSLLAAALAASIALPIPRAVLGAVLWLSFAAVIYGNDFFGLLTSRWMTLLGHVSYSIYLIHGLVLSLSVLGLQQLTSVASLSSPAYWVFIGGVGALMLWASMGLYRLAEAPFIAAPHARTKAPARAPRAAAEQPSP